MGNFRDNKRSGGGGGGSRGGFGGGRGGGGRGGFGGDRGRSEMHHATCSDCGRDCEVPFKPTRGKDVFCNNCFKKDGDSGSRGYDKPSYGRSDRGGGRDSGRPGMHKATCADCGNRCEVPFRPTGDKPVYCSNCFGGGGHSDRRGDDRGSKYESKKPDQSDLKFEELNKKLDKILKMLDIIHPKKSFTVKKADLDMESSEEKEEVKEKPKPALSKAEGKKAPAKKKAVKKAPAKKKAAKKAPAKKAPAKKKRK